MRAPEIAFILCSSVGAFEAVVWGWDPLGVHRALNDGKEVKGAAVAALVNGLLPFLCGLTLLKKWRRSSSFLVPFLVAFTFMQWAFWWWPYLLGEKAGMVDMVSEHKMQLEGLPRWLPPRGDNLIPDIEHTLLMPLSLATMLAAALAYRQNGALGSAETVFFMLASVFFTGVISVTVFTACDPSGELGLMLVMACILFVSLMVSATTPRVEKVTEKNQ